MTTKKPKPIPEEARRIIKALVDTPPLEKGKVGKRGRQNTGVVARPSTAEPGDPAPTS